MKLIDIECDIDRLHINQATLSDAMKQALHADNESLFGLLEFTNDYVFLEPTLLCYFLSSLETAKKITLQQILYGYVELIKKPAKLKLKSDLFGFANIPNVGYVKMEPFQEQEWHMHQLVESVVKSTFVEQSSVRLCMHPTDELALARDVFFDESTAQTFQRNKLPLEEACGFLQKWATPFWELIESVTREFVVFSSPNQNSFASISHHGTAYFNTENKNQTAVFFVDDISHQCGHVIFNALTLDTDRYLKVAKDNPLSEFIENKNDTRGVYGALHGLFTYTCILYSLDKLLASNWNENYKREAVGRLGFYMNKFRMDLINMDNPKILTEEGMSFHEQFQESYNYIFERYREQIMSFDFSNQPYTFQYDLFKKANPIR
jgi:hypothetical protein